MGLSSSIVNIKRSVEYTYIETATERSGNVVLTVENRCYSKHEVLQQVNYCTPMYVTTKVPTQRFVFCVLRSSIRQIKFVSIQNPLTAGSPPYASTLCSRS